MSRAVILIPLQITLHSDTSDFVINSAAGDHGKRFTFHCYFYYRSVLKNVQCFKHTSCSKEFEQNFVQFFQTLGISSSSAVNCQARRAEKCIESSGTMANTPGVAHTIYSAWVRALYLTLVLNFMLKVNLANVNLHTKC